MLLTHRSSQQTLPIHRKSHYMTILPTHRLRLVSWLSVLVRQRSSLRNQKCRVGHTSNRHLNRQFTCKADAPTWKHNVGKFIPQSNIETFYTFQTWTIQPSNDDILENPLSVLLKALYWSKQCLAYVLQSIILLQQFNLYSSLYIIADGHVGWQYQLLSSHCKTDCVSTLFGLISMYFSWQLFSCTS